MSIGRDGFTFANMTDRDNFDPEKTKILQENLSRWSYNHKMAIKQFSAQKIIKNKALNIRLKSLYNLENLIFNFEEKFTKQGGKVMFAHSDKDVQNIITELIKTYDIKKTALTKSNIIDELKIKEYLKKKSINYFNTNIGEYIVDKENKHASHIVMSAIHTNLEEIISLGIEGINDGTTLEEAVNIISKDISNKIEEADCLISGANFLISDTGSIVIVENEANIIRSKASVKNHIVLIGIEKVIPSITDLDVMLPVLSTYATGQKLASLNNIISQPAKISNTETQNLIVILVNNNRTDLLKDKELRKVFRCIGCGACANTSSVYSVYGGHCYDNSYPGPLGCIKSPYIESMKQYKHLLFVSPLNGMGEDICPLSLNTDDLIIYARNNIITQELNDIEYDKLYTKFFRYMTKHRVMNAKSKAMKQWKIDRRLSRAWGHNKKLPQFAKTSFSKQYISLSEKENKK